MMIPHLISDTGVIEISTFFLLTIYSMRVMRVGKRPISYFSGTLNPNISKINLFISIF